MNTYTISFFGHRDFCEHHKCEEKLEEIIRSAISSHNYVNFLVGRNGEFDIFASSVIKRIKKEREENYFINLTLVLPYMTSEFKNNAEYFEKYYDTIEICSVSQFAHFKSAITLRNREMVDRSDMVVCFVKHPGGGAAATLHYAKSIGKNIINLFGTPSHQ